MVGDEEWGVGEGRRGREGYAHWDGFGVCVNGGGGGVAGFDMEMRYLELRLAKSHHSLKRACLIEFSVHDLIPTLVVDQTRHTWSALEHHRTSADSAAISSQFQLYVFQLMSKLFKKTLNIIRNSYRNFPIDDWTRKMLASREKIFPGD